MGNETADAHPGSCDVAGDGGLYGRRPVHDPEDENPWAGTISVPGVPADVACRLVGNNISAGQAD